MQKPSHFACCIVHSSGLMAPYVLALSGGDARVVGAIIGGPIALCAYLVPAIRKVERELPDHGPGGA